MNTNNNFKLSEEEINNFHKNGYAGPFTAYEQEEMSNSWNRVRRELYDRSKAVYRNDQSTSGFTNIANYDRHLDVSFLAKHISKRNIVEKVSSILGPDVLCWRSEFFPKEPGDEGTDWHQADTFENVSGSPQILWPDNSKFGGTITVWTAFTDVTIDMGALQFIPGTHTTMFYDESKATHYDPNSVNSTEKDGRKRGFFGYDYRDLQIDPNWKPNEEKAVSMEMKRGQFIMFWSTLMHASHPHLGTTNQMRMAYVSRYVPSSVKIYPDTDVVKEYGGSISLEKYGAVLVSGKIQDDHNRMAVETTRGERFDRYDT